MPDEPECIGLLALMTLQLARAEGRFSADGRRDEAREADRRALVLTENPAERSLLLERIGR